MELDLERVGRVLDREVRVRKETLRVESILVSDELQNRRPKEVIGSRPDVEFKEHVSELACDIERNGQKTRLILAWDGNKYWLMDGHHRLAALKRLASKGSRIKAKAYVFDCSFTQAKDIVLTCVNRDVKKTLTSNERTRLAFEAYIADSNNGERLRAMSLRKTAHELNISKSTIERFDSVMSWAYRDYCCWVKTEHIDPALVLPMLDKARGCEKTMMRYACEHLRYLIKTYTWQDLINRIKMDAWEREEGVSSELWQDIKSIEECIEGALENIKTQQDVKAIVKVLRKKTSHFNGLMKDYPTTEDIKAKFENIPDDF